MSTVAFQDVKSINLLAAPMFSLTTDRISRGSAQFVDVVHTAGLLTSIEEPIGHADFYPNGPGHPMCVQYNDVEIMGTVSLTSEFEFAPSPP